MRKEDKAKIRMTVIHFETESSNATLEENVKAISQTLTRALSQAPRIIQQSPGSIAQSGTPVMNDIEVGSENLDGVEQEFPESRNNGTRKTGAARRYPSPKILDIDLTEGAMPLKTFLEERKPDGETKRYLAIAYWLKTYRNLAEIDPDHVYTCYRHMTWQIPDDTRAAFRTMKRKQYGWMNNGKTSGMYSINHIGEGEVEKWGAGVKS